MKKILVTIIILVVLGGLVFVYILPKNKTAQTNPQPDNSNIPPLVTDSTSTQTETPSQNLPKTETVTYTDSGFSPKEITIKAGDTVNFVNESSKSFWPASNPHPVHTDYPEFDAKKDISAGDTYSFKFEKVGTWGYHNHKNPSQIGTVIVTTK